MVVEVEDNIDVISQLFPSFYQSTNTPNEFLIHDSLENVINLLTSQIVEFVVCPNVVKIILNEKCITIVRKSINTTQLVFDN